MGGELVGVGFHWTTFPYSSHFSKFRQVQAGSHPRRRLALRMSNMLA